MISLHLLASLEVHQTHLATHKHAFAWKMAPHPFAQRQLEASDGAHTFRSPADSLSTVDGFSPDACEHLRAILRLKMMTSHFRPHVGGNVDPLYGVRRGKAYEGLEVVCEAYKCPSFSSGEDDIDLAAAMVCGVCGRHFDAHEDLDRLDKSTAVPAWRAARAERAPAPQTTERRAPPPATAAPLVLRPVAYEDTSDPTLLSHANDPLAVFAPQRKPLLVAPQVPAAAAGSVGVGREGSVGVGGDENEVFKAEVEQMIKEELERERRDKLKAEMERLIQGAQSMEDMERIAESMKAAHGPGGAGA